MLETATATPAQQTDQLLLEVVFPVMPGSIVPSLHGYSLYGALKNKLSWIGTCPDTAISSISGYKNGDGTLETQGFSQLRIRTPLSKASGFYALAGQTLSLGQGQITLKVPTITPLVPKSKLQARLVVIHLKEEGEEVPPDRFLAVATRQLADRAIKGRVSLLLRDGALDRKVLRVKGKQLPGYGLEVSGLSETDSLKLQAIGLGGKRKMGAGFFQ